MKSLIIGLPIVIACLISLALAIGSMALADAVSAPKAAPFEHVGESKRPPA